MAEKTKEFKSLSDSDLLELLFSSGDDLPQEAVDEMHERGERFIPLLNHILLDKNSWTEPMPEWWGVVHAAYILGSFETMEALPGLLAALRWADAFDNEWVTEDLPSMFGKVGRPSYAPLLQIVQDYPAGWGARSIALSGLAAVAVQDKLLRPSVLDLMGKIVENEVEPLPLRQTAANILLDFRSKKHRSLLKKFGKEEAQRKEEIPNYEGAFYDWEVEEFMSADSDDLEYYTRDWMAFYDPEERERRHDYWEEERELRLKEEDSGKKISTAQKKYPHCPCGSGLPYEDCCMKKVH